MDNIWEEDNKWFRLASCGHTVQCSNKGNARDAAKKSRKCQGCARLPENNPMYGRSGELNPFYGKTHSSEVKKEWSNQRKGRKLSPEWRAKVTKAILEHGNKRPLYDIWIEKYGIEVANQKLTDMKAKHSANNSGSGNPMYGKPTPQGAGNGWKGYYQGQFFRSLRELSFMAGNPTYKSAEGNHWRAEYTDPNGSPRTTIPDFVDDQAKIVVECKPKRLHQSPSVLVKATAMQDLCESRGYSYHIVDPPILAKDEMLDKVEAGEIVFCGDYEQKVREWNG